MDVTIETRSALESEADLLALPLVELDPAKPRLPARVAALDRAAGGRIAQALAARDFEGKRGQSLLVGLRDIAGWSAADVTAALGISEPQQRRLLHQARSQLRRVLDSYLAEVQ